MLKRGKHHSVYLQNFYNKYNPIIRFEIIEETTEDQLFVREFYWIKFYQSYKPKFGFNESFNPRSSKGFNPIAQYTLSGKYIRYFNNIKEAEIYMKANGYTWSQSPHKRLQVGGFQWKKCDVDNIPLTIDSVETFYCKYTESGEFIKYYKSLKGFKHKSNLLRAITEEKLYAGFYWKLFKSEKEIIKKYKFKKPKTVAKKVVIYNEKEEKEFNSVTEASKYIGTTVYSVSRVLSKSPKLSKYKTVKGFKVKLGT